MCRLYFQLYLLSILYSNQNAKKLLQISQLHGTGKIGCRPVATGNWGCGNSLKGDVQLKLVIQWMAASVSGIPLLLYYTSGDEKLTKV